MPADKMPKMPEPVEFIWWMGINENHKARAAKRYYTHDEVVADRRACYLAGIAAARECVPTQGANVYGYSFNDCRETTLANLDALGRE